MLQRVKALSRRDSRTRPRVLTLGTSALKPNRPEEAADFPLTVVLIISMNVYAHTNPLLRPFRARCLLGCVPQG